MYEQGELHLHEIAQQATVPLATSEAAVAALEVELATIELELDAIDRERDVATSSAPAASA